MIKRILPMVRGIGLMLTAPIPWTSWRFRLPCPDEMWRRAVAQRERLVGGE